MAWLYPLVDGAPPMGWTYALSYIALPVALVISQFVRGELHPYNEPADDQQHSLLGRLPQGAMTLGCGSGFRVAGLHS